MIKNILAVIVQVILGFLLGLILPYSLYIGDGWEQIAIPVGIALGVYIGGALFLLNRRTLVYGVGALVGAAVGMGIILVIPPFGFVAAVIPLASAIVGYYIIPTA